MFRGTQEGVKRVSFVEIVDDIKILSQKKNGDCSKTVLRHVFENLFLKVEI